MENKAIAPQQRGVSKKDQVSAFKNLLECKYYQEQLKNVLKENSGTFATSVMEAVTSNDSLLACDPKKIMGEVVKAAGMKLPVNKQLGYCYILPFKNHGVPTPTLIVGYKGYIQLAMRTGQYRNINADIVYEGEYKGYDKVTGRLDLSGERTSNKVIGYFSCNKSNIKSIYLTSLYFISKGITFDELVFFQENKGITCKKYNLDLFIDDKERVLDDVKKAGIKTLRITDDKESKHDIVHNWLEIKDYVDSLGV